jgi:hypothetical protein
VVEFFLEGFRAIQEGEFLRRRGVARHKINIDGNRRDK